MTIINDPEAFIKESFDYLVVGGGTAGLVVAARLSEDPNITVGVVEAGAAGLSDPSILTPAAFPTLVGRNNYDWRFETVPQVHHVFPQGCW